MPVVWDRWKLQTKNILHSENLVVVGFFYQYDWRKEEGFDTLWIDNFYHLFSHLASFSLFNSVGRSGVGDYSDI